MDDANRRRQRRRLLALLAEARAVETAATRLLAEVEDRVWLADCAAALGRARAWWGRRWRWN